VNESREEQQSQQQEPETLPRAKEFFADSRGRMWEVMGFAKIPADELREGLGKHEFPVGTEMEGPIIKGVFKLVAGRQ